MNGRHLWSSLAEKKGRLGCWGLLVRVFAFVDTLRWPCWSDSIRVRLKLVFITFSMVTSSDVVENSLPQSTSPALRQKKMLKSFKAGCS